MTYLSKIIFINSAHIRHSTVMLDGNVHFTGTQGVGKSTLLRAILFFYNADKMHLGIRQQGQKKFDDFYLPRPTSYIIYEVNRGEMQHPFSVIVFKHRNNAAFRFVDAAFQDDWLLDENGNVTSDPILVRQRIQQQGIHLSSIIDRYEQYRDILYGNSHSGLPRDIRKYCILESTQYQNIPRIIQNVFLNERVDADFIKDTIIRSMSGDDEMRMDLRFFRYQLADFRQEYEDIQKWSKKNRQGEIEVLNTAKSLIDTSHNIHAKDIQLREQCGFLNYAIQDAEKNIPLLHKEIGDIKLIIQSFVEKLSSIRADYSYKHDKLVGDIKVLDTKIRESHRKQKDYEKIGIEQMLRLAEEEPMLLGNKKQLEKQVSELERQYDDIVKKYQAIIERLKMELQQFEQDKQQLIINKDRDFIDHQAKRMKEQKVEQQEIAEEFEARFDILAKQKEELKETEYKISLKIKDIANSEPYEKEINDFRQKIDELKDKQNTLRKENDERLHQMDTLRKESAIEVLKLRNSYVDPLKEIDTSIKELEKLITDENELLNRAKGSFCEWLDENVPDWVETIGKVADERKVLYHNSLSPQIDEHGSNNLFGVKIDLSEIERDVRTPQQIESSRNDLIIEQNKEKKRLSDLYAELDNEIRQTEENYSAKHKELHDIYRTTEQLLMSFPGELKKVQLQLDELIEKQQSERDRLTKEQELEKENVLIAISDIQKQYDSLTEKKTARIRALDKRIRDEEKQERTALDSFKKEIQESINRQTKETNKRIASLEAELNKDLKDGGAEIDLIDSCKERLREVEKQLSQIKQNSEIIAYYKRDREEYFLQEPEFYKDKHKLETDRDTLNEKYQKKRIKLEADKTQQETLRQQKEKQVEEMERGLEEANDFLESESCPAFIKEVMAISTKDSCSIIVGKLMRLQNELALSENRLKESINTFRSYFSERNTFKFPLLLNSSTDYLEYAQSVDDFVSNYKIQEYQQLTSNVYIDIISRVSRDFGDMLVRESEIQKVVKDVNYDFAQKSFAGVIRSIELKLERSNRPIILQLQNIHEFWQENSLELGQLNLFSTDNRSEANKSAVKYLERLTEELNRSAEVDELKLSDTFSLKFKIVENDNSTGWIDNIKMVGSDGTDILVKAIINILLISVFKQRVSKRSGDFRIHCMMDEIGKLADENIQGILDFANQRNIFVVNSSPKSHRPLSYRRIYVLSKDKETNYTIIKQILSTRQAELQ